LATETVVSNEFPVTRSLVGTQGLWFLSAGDKPEVYRILPIMSGSVPFEMTILPTLPSLPPNWRAPSQSAAPLELVLRELAAYLEVNTGSVLGGEFLSQVAASPGSELARLYTQMTTSSSPVVLSAGIAGLIRSGDVTGLAFLQSASGNIGSSLAQAVCEYANGNPRGVVVLGELATTSRSVARLQECAAYALRRIHTRESLPLLASLLDSPSPTIRYEGVAGLASYANSGLIPNEPPLLVDGVPTSRAQSAISTAETQDNFPTLDTFRKDEQRFIAFWKQWQRQIQ
jgi:hypothetical protein